MEITDIGRRSGAEQGAHRHRSHQSPVIKWMICLLAITPFVKSVYANGGPFVVKYPGGDPAARGVLARLDPGLKPARESRLHVVKEDLSIEFMPAISQPEDLDQQPPLVSITAEYKIRNPESETIEIDFGFPILRGIFVNPLSMRPMPDVHVRIDESERLRPTLLSNSALLGILRQQAQKVIKRSVRADHRLRILTKAVSASIKSDRSHARRNLGAYLRNVRLWPANDAALFVEYVSLKRPEPNSSRSPMRSPLGHVDADILAAGRETSWATAAIGDKKATQWLVLLARRFDPSFKNGYETLFKSWGGDIRELSIDLKTRQTRLREIDFSRLPSRSHPAWIDADSTIYARVDYLSSNKSMTREEKNSWNAVLKNLPVVFTFAPMNLLHYRAIFPANSARTVTVSYRQHAYLDTRRPFSYQVAYLLHPASFWDSFGPIRLRVSVPENVAPVTGLDMRKGPARTGMSVPFSPRYDSKSSTYEATLHRKTGELIVGISQVAWAQAMRKLAPSRQSRLQIGARR